MSSRWRTALSLLAALAAFTALAAALSSGLGLVDMARWAAAQQKAFHTLISRLMSMEGGGLAASAALIGASLAYGFAHAAIPGHGKFLIAGAGLSTRMSALRLVALSLAASFAQALTAIILVYGSFAALNITAGFAMTATDRVLIPLSYMAILFISVVLMRRAVRGLKAAFAGDTSCTKSCCGHRHGPTQDEMDGLTSWRDALALVVSIGMRPCTGAVFILVAAWRLDLLVVGAAAAFAMALGTGGFTSIVAISSVSARGATLFAAGRRKLAVAVPLLQLGAGGVIFMIAVTFLVATLGPF
ncbi:MAG: hypothetical protein AAF318_17520 [Pseudomonadota bacterium]